MKTPRFVHSKRSVLLFRLTLIVATLVMATLSILPATLFAQAIATGGSASAPSTFLPMLVQFEALKPNTDPPVILSFTANPALITLDTTSTLSWQISNADSVEIQPALDTVSGNIVSGDWIKVKPVKNTEYTLTATNAHGTATAKVSVTVQEKSNDFQYSTFLLPYDIDHNAFVSKVPQLRIDQKDGLHVVYTASYPDDSGALPVYYAYCPANCTSASAFSVTHFGTNIDSAQLELDAQGHPRLLLASEPPSNDVARKIHWSYAECNAGCTNPAQWTVTEISAAHSYWGVVNMESSQQFALDAEGNPRFVYYADSFGADEDQPIGTIFTYCDGNCTVRSNWFSTILTDQTWENPALQITSKGLPRIAYVSGDYQTSNLGYVECSNPACTKYNANPNIVGNSTATLALSEYTFALRLDSHDRPRFAYYPGYGDSGTLPGIRTYYLACDAKDCTQAGTWYAIDLGLPRKLDSGLEIWVGDNGVDIQFDAQDRPRIALRLGYSVDELVYIYCNSGCLDQAKNWTYYVLWSTSAQSEDMGLPPQQGCPDCHPPIPPCPAGFWDAGYWPSLALDSAGDPRIAYEIQEQTGGGYCTAATWARMTRFATFEQP